MKGSICQGNCGSYQLNTRLGSGGFGQTWEATITDVKKSNGWLVKSRPRQGDRVVIKWANLQERYSPAENRAFLQDVNSAINSELSALSRLAGLRCVARVYDYGLIDLTLGDGSPQGAIFLVEEFLDGKRFDTHLLETFGRVAGEVRTFDGIEDPGPFLNLATSLAAAVREIHHLGVIHGDIWQENIMVMDSDELRFFDLGASAVRDTAFLRPDTLARQRSDTYCAPERRRGERHGRRSDIYSLGGLFYFMATGKHPPDPIPDIDQLKNTIVATMNASNPHLLISNCGIADIIARCLRYNKDQRIRDADALLGELRLFSFSDLLGSDRDASQDCVKCLLGEGKTTDSLFSRMLKMDAARLKSRADGMRRGILEVSGDHEDLVLGMSAYLSVLNEQDAFLARTTPRFWKTENMGINGRFLSMVTILAQRGIKVKHLMLVCESDRTDPEHRRILEAHLAAMRQVGTSIKGELQFRCKVVSADDRERLTRETRWECCYAISKNEIKVLQPVYDRTDILRTVRFVRQEPITSEQVLRNMEKELFEAISLASWLRGNDSG